ncbi:MAG: hypothetical protein DHS20C15_07530 [Planctomycetota bacterium]|nr:MAG: hypothetical protein DHS20C15_07530 [Planctomycetota bacterium]
MDKRFLPALVMSLLFVMVYQTMFMEKPPVQPAAEGGADAGRSAAGDPASGAGLTDNGAPLGGSSMNTGAAKAGGDALAGATGNAVDAPQSSAPDATARLDDETQTSVWTSRGAALQELALLDYITPEGDPLPVIGRLDGEHDSLLLRDVRGRYGLDYLNWDLAESPGELRFQLLTADGLRFERVVREDPRSHTLSLEINVSNVGEVAHDELSLVLQGARGLVDEEAGSKWYGKPRAVAVLQRPEQEAEIESWEGSALSSGESRRVDERERVLGAGTMTTYFCSVFVPEGDTDVRQLAPVLVPDRMKHDRHDRDGDVPEAAAVEASLRVPSLAPGASQSFQFSVYTGPKSKDVAAEAGLEFLTPIIEVSYGKWAWINRTLLTVLRFFHSIFGNWGVAVIILTLLVKGLLFPLNRRQQTSMLKYSSVMQKLKPQLEELKKKHKGNTKKFNEAQMKLLSEHGARPPLGGCLLMFLQFPIWISLFQILGTSIELRQSSFVGWIDDLSRPDAMPLGIAGFETLNVLPILMAAATILQMRAQAKPADEQQAQTQKIMGTIMPLFMLWFLYDYPAGLSLYIFTSSLLGVFEMRVIRKIWPIDDGKNSSDAQPAPAS